MQKMAGLFGMSIRTVHRAVHGLAKKGLIRIQARFRQPNHYHLLIPASDEARREIQPPNGDKPGTTQPPDGDKSRSEPGVRVTNLASKGDKSGKLTLTKMAGVPPKKESPKKDAQDFSNSDLEGSKPDEPEREPTVAEIEAKRREYAATLGTLPQPLAAALSKLVGSVKGIAYAPGFGPRRTAEEQIELLTPKRPPVEVPAAILAAIRASSARVARPVFA